MSVNSAVPSWGRLLTISALASSIILSGCNTDAGTTPSADTTSGYSFPSDAVFIAADAADGSDITTAIINAVTIPTADTVYVLPKGNFVVSSTITIPSADGVTLTGYGMAETILDFSTSTGDDGIKFEGGLDVTIRDLGVYEAPKNGIKVINANGVHMVATAAVWETPMTSTDVSANGAYGLYPLQSQNILMEDNYAYGSADAGIYVGQSSNIVVRGNHAEHNIAGIEIENSHNADVYNNTAIGNTGGILAFDLPGLSKAYGGSIRIFNNNSSGNDLDNFVEGGGTVGIVPPGTGVLIFAVSDVEIYDNQLTENDTSAVSISSYFLADDQLADYPANYGTTMGNGWSPLVKNLYIHDNTIEDNGGNARGSLIADMVAGWESAANASGTAQVFPAILYGAIGEALSNVGSISGFDALVGAGPAADGIDYDAYAAADLICENNNDTTGSTAVQNTGLVYPTNNPSAPVLLIDTIASGTYLSCTQPRLSPAVVIFKGVTYGCTGDDLAEAACAL